MRRFSSDLRQFGQLDGSAGAQLRQCGRHYRAEHGGVEHRGQIGQPLAMFGAGVEDELDKQQQLRVLARACFASQLGLEKQFLYL